MIYQVIGYFRSPDFVYYIHRRLVHMTHSDAKSLFDFIQSGVISEAQDLAAYRFTEQFHEKQTFVALKNFMHAEQTMSCFRRVFMSRAHKYINPDDEMTTDGQVMTDSKALVLL